MIPAFTKETIRIATLSAIPRVRNLFFVFRRISGAPLQADCGDDGRRTNEHMSKAIKNLASPPNAGIRKPEPFHLFRLVDISQIKEKMLPKQP
ncbi:MAG TPA: hypothetical protein VEI46_08975, partial [Thermodesulfovibrionales bacterium]|nr:hypothetical protein [Thermodesulfovibrionales bacterium]